MSFSGNLNNFISATQCCLSQKGNTLLNRMRGGSIDTCCMTHHAFASAVLSVLKCANITDTSAIDIFNLNLVVTNVCHFNTSTLTCYDTYSASGSIYQTWVGATINANTVLLTGTYTKVGGSPVSFTYTTNPLVFTPSLVSLPNLVTTGSNNGVDEATVVSTDSVSGEYVVLTFSFPEVDPFEHSCLTEEKVCDLVSFLNEYCGNCNSYPSKPVT